MSLWKKLEKELRETSPPASRDEIEKNGRDLFRDYTHRKNTLFFPPPSFGKSAEVWVNFFSRLSLVGSARKRSLHYRSPVWQKKINYNQIVFSDADKQSFPQALPSLICYPGRALILSDILASENGGVLSYVHLRPELGDPGIKTLSLSEQFEVFLDALRLLQRFVGLEVSPLLSLNNPVVWHRPDLFDWIKNGETALTPKEQEGWRRELIKKVTDYSERFPKETVRPDEARLRKWIEEAGYRPVESRPGIVCFNFDIPEARDYFVRAALRWERSFDIIYMKFPEEVTAKQQEDCCRLFREKALHPAQGFLKGSEIVMETGMRSFPSVEPVPPVLETFFSREKGKKIPPQDPKRIWRIENESDYFLSRFLPAGKEAPSTFSVLAEKELDDSLERTAYMEMVFQEYAPGLKKSELLYQEERENLFLWLRKAKKEFYLGVFFKERGHFDVFDLSPFTQQELRHIISFDFSDRRAELFLSPGHKIDIMRGNTPFLFYSVS